MKIQVKMNTGDKVNDIKLNIKIIEHQFTKYNLGISEKLSNKDIKFAFYN